jgi:hypothetical protein
MVQQETMTEGNKRNVTDGKKNNEGKQGSKKEKKKKGR